MALRCEIPTDGDPCVEVATGRCETCGRSFCEAHQAADRSGGKVLTIYVDECMICFDAANAGD